MFYFSTYCPNLLKRLLTRRSDHRRDSTAVTATSLVSRMTIMCRVVHFCCVYTVVTSQHTAAKYVTNYCPCLPAVEHTAMTAMKTVAAPLMQFGGVAGVDGTLTLPLMIIYNLRITVLTQSKSIRYVGTNKKKL